MMVRRRPYRFELGEQRAAAFKLEARRRHEERMKAQRREEERRTASARPEPAAVPERGDPLEAPPVVTPALATRKRKRGRPPEYDWPCINAEIEDYLDKGKPVVLASFIAKVQARCPNPKTGHPPNGREIEKRLHKRQRERNGEK
jgi:hypothetical protein